MVFIDSSKTTIDGDKYDTRICKGDHVLYDRQKLEKAKDRMFANSGVYLLMALDKMMQKSRGTIRSVQKQAVLNYLKNWEFCPARFFLNHKVQSESLDMKRCLEPLVDNGYAQEFLDYYMTYKHLDSKCSSISKMFQQCRNIVVKNEFGKGLAVIPCHPSLQVNRRYNYRNYDIISQLPKEEVANCVSVEDGYVLAWGDFAQSDFRIAYNLFMRSPENDAIMNQCEDKYEGLARIVAKTKGARFSKEEFTQERSLYKKLTLATVYGKRKSGVPMEDQFIKNFTEFLMTCPKYMEFYQNAQQADALGIPVAVESYFGYEQTVQKYEYDSSVLERTLNSPIQTGTSEIVMFSTNYLLDTFRAMGYSEEDVSLYYVRHDEIVLKMRKSVMKDSWLLDQLREIRVDDWTPLSLTFEFGYYYNEPDETLTKKFNQSCKTHPVEVEPIPKVHREWSPLQPVLELHVGFVRLGSEAVISIYNRNQNTAWCHLLESCDDEIIIQKVVSMISKLRMPEYRGIIVKSPLLEGQNFYKETRTFVRYVKVNLSSLSVAYNICLYKAYSYCKAHGLEYRWRVPGKEQTEEIQSVKKFEELYEV